MHHSCPERSLHCWGGNGRKKRTSAHKKLQKEIPLYYPRGKWLGCVLAAACSAHGLGLLTLLWASLIFFHLQMGPIPLA